MKETIRKYYRKTRSFLSLQNEDKKLFLLAVLYLAWGRMLLLVPIKYWKHYLNDPISYQTEFETNSQIKRKVQRAVKRMSLIVPWQSKCLVQSIASVHLLRHYNIHQKISLGIAKGKDNELIAHAWLKMYENPRKFKEIA